MSSVSALSVRKAVPVVIGGVTVFCEGFRASAVRSIAESSTADGGMVFTGSSSRSTKLVFSGRVCTSDSPESLLTSFNSLVHSDIPFDVEYMKLSLKNCRMLAYTFIDKGGEWSDISVTLVTADDFTGSDAS